MIDESGRTRTPASRRVETLREKKDRLLRAFLYDQAVDRATYDRENLRLSEELTLAELESHEEPTDDLDLDAHLEFARELALTSGNLWKQSELDTRRALQTCLFPDGIRYRQGTILNTTMCPIFSGLEAFQAPDARMASPTGFEPRRSKLRSQLGVCNVTLATGFDPIRLPRAPAPQKSSSARSNQSSLRRWRFKGT